MIMFTFRGFFSEQLDDLGGRTLRWESKRNAIKKSNLFFSTRATSFNLSPFTYTTSDGRHRGWESSIMLAVAESLNFRQNSSPIGFLVVCVGECFIYQQVGHKTTPKWRTLGGEHQWLLQWPGQKKRAFCITWLLVASWHKTKVGMLQRGDSDIGWADLFIIPDRYRFLKNSQIIF